MKCQPPPPPPPESVQTVSGAAGFETSAMTSVVDAPMRRTASGALGGIGAEQLALAAAQAGTGVGVTAGGDGVGE